MKTTLTLEQYLDQNRAAIIAYLIKWKLRPQDTLRTDDNSLRLWLLNDRELYVGMLANGVDADEL